MAKKFGRPRIYNGVDEMEADIAAYFQECIDENKAPSIAGLAYAINMTTETLRNYEKKAGFEEFFAIVKRAKQLVEVEIVEGGLSGNLNTSMAIFLCKANFGYEDKTVLEHSGPNGEKLGVTVTVKKSSNPITEEPNDDEGDDGI